jgi:P-type E1-E2 ATPase
MLTGDSLAVAQDVCLQCGIEVNTMCKARLLPADKLLHIQALEKSANQRVMMIGDGINDAAALAGATVGVAMGAGGTVTAGRGANSVFSFAIMCRNSNGLRCCRHCDDER